MRSSVALSTLLALIVSSSFLRGVVRGDDYFEGDGTAYTLSDTSAGNCNFMSAPAAAANNYAALNDPQWASTKNCGRCAEVSCSDASCADKTKKEVVYILDRCPECKYGDLDLSPTVFTKITGQGPSRLKIKWKFVDCPVSGGIKYCLKGGSNNFWTAVQPANTVAGVSSMLINGKTPTMVDSAYYYLLNGNSAVQTDLGSVKVTLTSVGGETVEETVSLSAGSCTDGKLQFKTGNAGGSNGGGSGQQQQTTSAPVATTAAPATTAPLTQKPTTAPVTPTPVKQSTEIDSDADNATNTPSPSPSPSATTSTNSTSNGFTILGSDEAGQPGTVSAPDESSSSALQVLTPAPVSEDRSNESTVSAGSSSKNSNGGGSDDNVNNANTKSTAGDASTSPVLIVLAVAAIVGVVALAIVAAISQKKKLDDKRADRQDHAMQRSFDNFASPVRVNSEIAEL